jgi:hypothetical protein
MRLTIKLRDTSNNRLFPMAAAHLHTIEKESKCISRARVLERFMASDMTFVQ